MCVRSAIWGAPPTPAEGSRLCPALGVHVALCATHSHARPSFARRPQVRGFLWRGRVRHAAQQELWFIAMLPHVSRHGAEGAARAAKSARHEGACRRQ